MTRRKKNGCRKTRIRVRKPIHTVRVSAPKGVKVHVTHRKSSHNPVTVSLGRRGFSFGYQRGEKQNGNGRGTEPRAARDIRHYRKKAKWSYRARRR